MAPIPDQEELAGTLEKYIRENPVVIFSKTTCPFCTQVKELFNNLQVAHCDVELDQIEAGRELHQALINRTGRKTVPQVFVNGEHIGGCDDTLEANKSGRIEQLLDPGQFDYDLIVIGGGSGGLAASKAAANLGKKVAVFDFVPPTPIGTSWGLGGTCVNVGCIPKKLMHQAALLGQYTKDAKAFGWELPEQVNHNWGIMRENIQNYIKSLNWNYRVQLREKQVKYLNSYARFIEPHKVKAVDKKGNETLHTARKFIVATGERPRYPDIPGAKEYCITSDDLFSLKYCPGKTLVIGASYVALECAGFLHGIGLDVTLMVRSIFLRGFDQEMGEKIGAHMAQEGVRILRPCVPVKVEKLEDGAPGQLEVTAKMLDTRQEIVETYNTVLLAIGREACTSDIGLEAVGVKVNPQNGKIAVINEQTNVPYIYAIGDILEGKLELTPVAIEAGILLAERLFNNGDVQCDYLNVPTTVFTPLEYGSVGYSEENALKEFGDDNIEVFHMSFTPLEWTLPARGDGACYIKLICLIPENERVIGLHFLGPNAGEVTQGFAVAVKKGATKADIDATIGIHPTCAEWFTTLTATKRSGAASQAKGC